MKNRIVLLLGAIMLSSSLLAQKKNQSELLNDIYIGYGAGSVYYFTGTVNHDYQEFSSYYYYDDNDSEPRSVGTFFFGYQRQLTKVISLGFAFSYMKLEQDISYQTYSYYGDSVWFYEGTSTDHLLNGITRVVFGYLDKPALKLYSAAAIGVTVDLANASLNGKEDSDRKILPAGQLTFIGIRAGRSLGGFLEFGIGTNGIINAGVSYKIGDE